MTTAGNRQAAADIVPATKAGRVISVALLLLGAALVAAFQFVVTPLLHETLNGAPASATLRCLRLAFGCLAVIGAGSGIWMAAAGWRIVRREQFPLPGAWVWRDTPVRRGAAAVRIGQVCIAGGLAATLAAVAVFAYAWTVLERWHPVHTLRPDVVVIKETAASKP